jgi:hypothetical protein
MIAALLQTRDVDPHAWLRAPGREVAGGGGSSPRAQVSATSRQSCLSIGQLFIGRR